jgi:sterol 3beta-glucosyltransferase
MKTTILTYGSRGDVQPFVALALGLQKAGHSVRLAGPYRFADFAAHYNTPFAALPGDPEEISALANDVRHDVFGAVKSVAEYVFSIAPPVLHAALAACDDADLIVHSFFFTTIANSLARARDIPDVSVQLLPMFMPTRAYPMVALPNVPPGALSYFTHWLTTQVFRYVVQMGLRQLRRAEPGIFSLKFAWPFDTSQPVQTPLLFAYSPTILPQPDDWKAPYIHITGFFFLEASETYRPPQELLDFLAAGDAPVCVTFGSMVNSESEWIDALVRAALVQTHQRGIILTGWGGRKPAEHTDDLFYFDAVPHDWLFPRCKSVIHHGGVGTTAAGLRAGIPNIIVPHAIDQPFWGKRVAAIGAGPAPIDLAHLSVETLAATFAQANSSALRARAHELGRLIRAEDGVGEAVCLIEQHAANPAYEIEGKLR